MSPAFKKKRKKRKRKYKDYNMQDTVESSELVADVCVLLVYVMGCITHCKEKKRLLHVKVIRDKV